MPNFKGKDNASPQARESRFPAPPEPGPLTKFHVANGVKTEGRSRNHGASSAGRHTGLPRLRFGMSPVQFLSCYFEAPRLSSVKQVVESI